MTIETQRIVVVQGLDGRGRRLNLSGARDLDIERREYSTGIDLLGVYVQPIAKRVIVHWYSWWDDSHGRVGGDSWVEADNDLISALASDFGCDQLAMLLPEMADAVEA